MDTIDIRRTSWIHNGYLTYRIYKMFDGRRWFQRHEWRVAGGDTLIDRWIESGPDFTQHMRPCKAEG